MIETISGDVEGTIKSRKYFRIDSVSGDRRIPQGGTITGNFDLSTVSGDIDLRIAD